MGENLERSDLCIGKFRDKCKKKVLNPFKTNGLIIERWLNKLQREINKYYKILKNNQVINGFQIPFGHFINA
jgi:hypothetical protein